MDYTVLRDTTAPNTEQDRVPHACGDEPATILTISAVACWHEATWQEEWTALPEEGGTFLRHLEKE